MMGPAALGWEFYAVCAAIVVFVPVILLVGGLCVVSADSDRAAGHDAKGSSRVPSAHELADLERQGRHTRDGERMDAWPTSKLLARADELGDLLDALAGQGRATSSAHAEHLQARLEVLELLRKRGIRVVS